MSVGRLFKLNERTLGVEDLASERKAVTIPTGATIRVLSAELDCGQTVEVLWDNRKIELFTCDVKMRGIDITDPSGKPLDLRSTR